MINPIKIGNKITKMTRWVNKFWFMLVTIQSILKKSWYKKEKYSWTEKKTLKLTVQPKGTKVTKAIICKWLSSSFNKIATLGSPLLICP